MAEHAGFPGQAGRQPEAGDGRLTAASAPGDGALEIERRRGLRLLTGGLGWLMIGLGPLLLVLLLATRTLHADALGAGRLLAVLALPAIGGWLVKANRRDWLVLLVDGRALELRRGRRRWTCRWPDVTALEVTTRRNGRLTVPTVRVTYAGAPPLYLDDVFTLRPPELADLLRRRCQAAGGLAETPALPDMPAARRPRRPGRGWLVAVPAAGLLILLALARVLRDMHS